MRSHRIVRYFKERIMKQYIMYVLVVTYVSIASASNTLQKMFFHESYGAESPLLIPQLGSIVLYFSNEPEVITEKIDKNNHLQEYTFIFPHTIVDKGFEDRTLLQKDTKERYSVHFDPYNAQHKGPLLSIVINPELVCLKCDRFVSVKGQKSLVFWLQNKQVVEQATAERTLLKVAAQQTKQKKTLLLS